MIGRVVLVIRALLGGEVGDRAVVRLTKSLRQEGKSPAVLCEALTRALERGARPSAKRHRGMVGTAAMALLAAIAGTVGLRALFSLIGAPQPWFLLVAAGGVPAAAALLLRKRRDGTAAAAVAYELMRIGVSPVTALDVALYAAGGSASALRRAMDAVALPAEMPDHARGSIAVLAARLDGPPQGQRVASVSSALALVAAVWIALSFWSTYLWALGRGFARWST